MKFYYGSGSPFSWTIWLVLEYKRLPYELNLLSLQNGDTKKPEYIAVNPRGKVPALVDDGFAIWETLPIIEYLEERYPAHRVLPADPNRRADARRLAAEVYGYLYPAIRSLMEKTLLLRPGEASDPAAIEAGINSVGHELACFDGRLQGDYFAGDLSMADFALYPFLALVRRLDERRPELGAGALMLPGLAAFMLRIEQLPYFSKTIPPHWKE